MLGFPNRARKNTVNENIAWDMITVEIYSVSENPDLIGHPVVYLAIRFGRHSGVDYCPQFPQVVLDMLIFRDHFNNQRRLGRSR